MAKWLVYHSEESKDRAMAVKTALDHKADLDLPQYWVPGHRHLKPVYDIRPLDRAALEDCFGRQMADCYRTPELLAKLKNRLCQ